MGDKFSRKLIPGLAEPNNPTQQFSAACDEIFQLTVDAQGQYFSVHLYPLVNHRAGLCVLS
jgi:hypothetical protein